MKVRFSLRFLLYSVVLFALGLFLYLRVWQFNHLIPALYTTSMFAAFAQANQSNSNQSSFRGALSGGAIGGIVSLMLDKLCCDLILPGFYEHEGLDLFGYTLLLSPIAIIGGMIIGVVVWTVASNV